MPALGSSIPPGAYRKGRARRTPTEIGQTVPRSPKQQRAKTAALQAISRGASVSTIYSPTARGTAPPAVLQARAIRTTARRRARRAVRRERERTVRRIASRTPQSRVREVEIGGTDKPKLRGTTLTVPKRTARRATKSGFAGKEARVEIGKAVAAPPVREQQRKFTTGKRTLPGLDKGQTRRAAKVLGEGLRQGASRKELLAAAETGLVESNFGNPTSAESDLDSAGWRQERQSIYGSEAAPKGPRNVKAAAKRFFSEAKTDVGTATARTAGELAQAVQGSAFPERYDEVKPLAKPIVREYLETIGKASDAGSYAKLGTPKGKPPPKQTVTRFKAIVDEAKKIDSANLPYLWGGGHVEGKIPGPRKQAYDCSGAVSRVLQAAGYDLPRAYVSGEFMDYGESGPGAVTIYANSGHVFMKIGNRYWGTSASNAQGGAGFIPKAVGQSEAQSGTYAVRHVPGLGQDIARRMGVRVDSAPGLRISEGGTVATITSGATVRSPGASNKPIRLEPRRARVRQERRRRGKQLVRKIIASEAPERVRTTGLEPTRVPSERTIELGL